MIKNLDEFCIFDIETYTIKDNALKVADNSKPKLGNLKDEEKIEKKKEEHTKKIIESGALKWYTGEIRSIAAYRYCDSEKRIFYNPLTSGFMPKDKSQVIIVESEKSLLEEFYQFINKKNIIGMNSKGFDIPFLIGRSLANEVSIPNEVKEYTRYISQIDDLITFSNSSDQRTSLANIAMALGLDGKLAKGSEVATMLEQGDHEKLIEYNMQDVMIVKEFLDRYMRIFKTKQDDTLNYEDVF